MNLEKYDKIFDSIVKIVEEETDVIEALTKIIEENTSADSGSIRTVLMSIKPVLNRFPAIEEKYNELADILRSRNKSNSV